MNNIIKNRSDIALLLVRFIVGGIFIYAGWEKVSNMAGTIGFFAGMGIPSFLAYFVSYAELIGGVLLFLGLGTCVLASLLSVIMIVAIWLVRAGGFMAFGLPLATLAGLIALIGLCGGKYSLKSCCDTKIS